MHHTSALSLTRRRGDKSSDRKFFNVEDDIISMKSMGQSVFSAGGGCHPDQNSFICFESEMMMSTTQNYT